MRIPLKFRPWQGMRFHIPNPPRSQSPHTLSMGIRERGGVLVGAEGPVDILVLPETVDLSRHRHGAAAQWVEQGAVVMWEAAFLKALHLVPPTP